MSPKPASPKPANRTPKPAPWQPVYELLPLAGRRAKPGEIVHEAHGGGRGDVACHGGEWVIREGGMVMVREDLDDDLVKPTKAFAVCRVCGCSELDACEGGCSWVADDLCSRC